MTQGQYLYSQKVEELIEEGFFDEADLVYCILSATTIYKKERDEMRRAVHHMKHTIRGRDTRGRPFYTVGKVMQSATHRYYFYITGHQADEG